MSNIHYQTYLIQQVLEQAKANALFDQYLEFSLSSFQQILCQRVLIPYKQPISLLSQHVNLSDKKYRIAIVVPSRTRTVDQLVLGFVENLKEIEDINFIPTIYNAEGNTYFLHSHILNDLLLHNYQLVYTVGMECTKAVSRFFQVRKAKIPVFFVGVHNPHELGFDTNYVTGVSAKYSNDDYVNAFLAVKPHMKKVGILYNPLECNGATDLFKRGIVDLLNKKNILSIPSALIKSEAISHQADALIRQIDTLVLLPDNMLARATKELSEKCNKAGVTLCSSYPYSIQDGAGLSFGYPDYVTGKIAAQKVAAILRDGTPINEIPIRPPHTEYQILINSKTQEKQGLKLNINTQIITKIGLIV